MLRCFGDASTQIQLNELRTFNAQQSLTVFRIFNVLKVLKELKIPNANMLPSI